MNPENKNLTLEENNMNAREVKYFLAKNQIKPLVLDEWEAGKGVLYVIDDYLREKYYGDWKPKSSTPVIALFHPYKVIQKESSDPIYSKECNLYNELGSKIYYFSINPNTKKINLERTSARKDIYVANLDNLFLGDSDIFNIPDQEQN